MGKVNLFTIFAVINVVVIKALEEYCPDENDFRAHGNLAAVTIRDGGWTMAGSSSFVTTKAAYNMLGGWVEFDADFSNVPTGVNANLYSIHPSNIDPVEGFKGSYSQRPSDYCDGQGERGDDDDSIEGLRWCPEHDFIESNGDCGGASALHTVRGIGYGPCNAWGCSTKFSYGQQPTVRMRISYNLDGTFTTLLNGELISSAEWSPSLNEDSNDDGIMRRFLSDKGAVLASSQWVGWVPSVPGCSTAEGNISQSSYTISNIKVFGTIVQGPTANLCLPTMVYCDSFDKYNRKRRYSKGDQVTCENKIFKAKWKSVKGGLEGNKADKRWKDLGACAIKKINCDNLAIYKERSFYYKGDIVKFSNTAYKALKKKVKNGLGAKVNKKKWAEIAPCSDE